MKIPLSPYTIAANCTDIIDCNDGITELWAATDLYKAAGQKVPEYIYKRIEKLHAKRDKCSLKEHGMKYDEWITSKFDTLEGASDGYIDAYKEALKTWLNYQNYKGDKRTAIYHSLENKADSAREFLMQTPQGVPNFYKISAWYFDEDITDYNTMVERIFDGLQGTKKAKQPTNEGKYIDDERHKFFMRLITKGRVKVEAAQELSLMLVNAMVEISQWKKRQYESPENTTDSLRFQNRMAAHDIVTRITGELLDKGVRVKSAEAVCDMIMDCLLEFAQWKDQQHEAEKGLQGTKKAGTNPAEPIQVPTLEFIILENTKKMTPTEGIACGNRHSLNGYPNDDANVIKKQNAINNIIDLLQNWHKYQIDAFNFKIFIAESLGVDTRFIYDDSTYRVFVFESDDSLKIRNSNHSATVSKFNERGEVANRNISIVIRNMKFKQTRNKKYINDNPTINAVEYVYFSNKTDNARLKLIAQAILHLLQTGEWNKNIAPADAQNPNQTHTREFKRWFGDWERNPQAASKVVDADGKPLVVYHGTTKDFTTFSKEKIGKANNGRYGFFFTPDESLATDFTRRRWQNPESQPQKNAHNIAVYLNLRNPLIVTAYQYVMNAVDNMDLSKYDGIIITPFSKEEKARWDSIWGKNSGSKEFDHNQYVVFSPNQIKSATDNNGNFSPESDNILEGVSGTISPDQLALFGDEPQPKQSHYGPLFDETDAKWNLTAEDIALIDELQKLYAAEIPDNEPERNRRNAQLAYCLIKFLNGEKDAVTKAISSNWYTTNKAYINPEHGRFDYIAEYFYHNSITRNIVRKYVPDLKGMSGSIKKMFEFLIELYKQRKADTDEKQLNEARTKIHGTGAKAFAEALSDRYNMGEKFDWAKAKKMAEAFKIGSEQELMQACELAVVLSARRIAHNGQSIAQRFAALKDLYDQQVTVRPLDTQSKILQQYSTPCPLAFLLGEFVLPKNYNGQWGYFLEPSAGNGMLTIALPESRTVVNEIDDIRRKNLEAQGFLTVLNHDASAEVPSADAFIGVITNPPFGKLPDKEKIERRGWAINTLDYKMAVVALDRMDKDGRAAIIVGGKMWNSYWKPLNERSQKKVLFGQWKTFLGYLYAQYNVVDVVYINGDNIYRKQGTQYPIVAILIDGRHDYNEAVKPNYVFDPDRDVIIDTYDQLFDRLMPHLQPGEVAADNRERRLRLAKAKAKALLLYAYAQKANIK